MNEVWQCSLGRGRLGGVHVTRPRRGVRSPAPRASAAPRTRAPGRAGVCVGVWHSLEPSPDYQASRPGAGRRDVFHHGAQQQPSSSISSTDYHNTHGPVLRASCFGSTPGRALSRAGVCVRGWHSGTQSRQPSIAAGCRTARCISPRCTTSRNPHLLTPLPAFHHHHQCHHTLHLPRPGTSDSPVPSPICPPAVHAVLLLPYTGTRPARRYEVSTGESSTSGTREALLEETDELWLELRHRFIADVYSVLATRFKEFQAKNKAARVAGAVSGGS